MQLVASAHTCRSMLASASAVQSHPPGCPGSAEEGNDDDLLVCKTHCTSDLQSVDRAAGVIAVDAPLLLGLAITGIAADLHDAPPAPPARALAQAPPGGRAPLYLSLHVLRN